MLFLEMSRDEDHGGGSWAFTKCVWAPTRKVGGGNWPFWSKILDIKQGDVILHLRGVPPGAMFIGYSTASSNGFQTSSRPPDPKAWSFSSQFYRADLKDFTPFHSPFNLNEVLLRSRVKLEEYFDRNKKAKGSFRKNIFYVRQNERLQCLNGAYLSEVDDDLFVALFGEEAQLATPKAPSFLSVSTGTQLVEVNARVGQSNFSERIKELYGYSCCFPGCNMSDRRFLIGSHIARWTDNEELRGHLGNGMCLCVFHDRAFELGVFTVDEKFRVYLNKKEKSSSVYKSLVGYHGKPIAVGLIRPIPDALLEHWNRVDVTPVGVT